MYDTLRQRHVGSLSEKLVHRSLLDGRPPILNLGLDGIQGSERCGGKKQIHTFAEVGHFRKGVRVSSKQSQDRRVQLDLAFGSPELAWPGHMLFLFRFDDLVRELEETAVEIEHDADGAAERGERSDKEYSPHNRKPTRDGNPNL